MVRISDIGIILSTLGFVGVVLSIMPTYYSLWDRIFYLLFALGFLLIMLGDRLRKKEKE